MPGMGSLQPSPGAAPAGRMVWSQARFELRLLLRNGEQVLLTLVIPLVLLVVLSNVGVVDLGAPGTGRRVDVVTPGILALAVISTAFTAQAIALGFDRRSGVLRLLATTPLPRWALVGGRTLAVLAIECLQVAVIVVVALLLGWHPQGSPVAVVGLLVAGTAAFSAWGIALAGLLRAEATLAVANAVYLVFLLGGATVIPLASLPAGLANVVRWLPSAALGDGLREVLVFGNPATAQIGLLLLWAAGGALLAARTFRWD
ncbi:MAG: ABC transporter permease [Actinomycetota bacterium]|nr:MAG: ABC transporter permease [Actinomycetota bacterium]